MTKQDLKEIEERAKEAIEGPWVTNGSTVYCSDATGKHLIGIAQVYGDDDERPKAAAFICHARSDIPLLLKRVEELKADRDKWRDLAERADDVLDIPSGCSCGDYGGPPCRECVKRDKLFADLRAAREGR